MADEYTIDRRQYVSDFLWSKEPYKYVLKVFDKQRNTVMCTANMVGGKIVTARHCIQGSPLKNFEFIAFDGRRMTASFSDTQTDYSDWDSYYSLSEDYVVLIPDKSSQNFVADNSINTMNDYHMNNAFISVGCGALKVMSNEEISKFKSAYMDFLADIDSSFGETVIDDDTINLTYMLSDAFYEDINPYLKKYGLVNSDKLFHDSNNIKFSVCGDVNLKDDLEFGLIIGACQGWHGDSGGGLYSVPGELVKYGIYGNGHIDFVGIHILGKTYISSNPSMHTSNQEGFVSVKEFKNNL